MVVALLLLLTLLAGAFFFLTARLLPFAVLQPGRRISHRTPEEFGVPYEHLRFEGADGVELDTFYVPATVTPRANFIMLHGVGSCKEVYLPYVAALARRGFNVMIWDQRAHGKSGGAYLTYGYREWQDVARAVDWLEARNPGLPTGIYGNSMGGAVALQSLAREPRLKFGLIESTFTDLREVTNAYGRRMSGFPLPYWVTDLVLFFAGRIANFRPGQVRPIDAARSIRQPVQLIHGDADANINVAHAHRLLAAIGSADKNLYLVAGGDHADLWEVGGKAYAAVWFGFLERMVR
ncbi:alpha/beta hydrolase [Lewinella sp. W8]|uniref:alpha/beta hydrolase n=1 Tax=Lewinella sp. W8 TaxID=2528208 RepID=UPI001067A30C|nr:alpha/beta fold hydrolase [Lewinella sp. W8]MTB52962.1 alpha/beta fold hydrolase [Lewinella sp. W8]